MKVSRYTFCFDTPGGESYLYNTLSNALIEVDRTTYDLLRSCKKAKNEISTDNFDAELWSTLIDKYILTENDEDDFLAYQATVLNLRNKNDFIHITIAPTMECHFNCHYCFEQNKKKGNMTSQTMDNIVKFLHSCREVKDLRLTWFGGEPLIAIEEIKTLYKKIKAAFLSTDFPDRTIVSDMITTGYALDEKTIGILQEIGIKGLQITLDGNKQSHNRIKHTPGCEDVFSHTLANLDLLTRKAPEIHITFRINLTKQNVGEYIPLYHYLIERYKGSNIGVAPAFVMDRRSSQKAHTDQRYFFNRHEATKYVLDLFNKDHIHSPWLLYPRQACAECAIRNKLSISFDPEGYAYKCWEIIGEKKYAIGQLDNNGELTNINSVVLNRQLYGADTLSDQVCSKCAYLPICNGGCPLHRIQNKFENWANECCTHFKGHLADFMRIHLQLKNSGYDNIY